MKAVLLGEGSDGEILLPGAAEQTLTGVEMDAMLDPLLTNSENDDDNDDDLENRLVLVFEQDVQELVHTIYKECQNIAKRSILNRSDLFYDMFPVETMAKPRKGIPSQNIWCIPSNHPINMLMNVLRKDPLERIQIKNIRTVFVFWDNTVIQDVMDYIIKECKKWNLDIQPDIDIEKEEDDNPVTVIVENHTQSLSSDKDLVTVNITHKPFTNKKME